MRGFSEARRGVRGRGGACGGVRRCAEACGGVRAQHRRREYSRRVRPLPGAVAVAHRPDRGRSREAHGADSGHSAHAPHAPREVLAALGPSLRHVTAAVRGAGADAVAAVACPGDAAAEAALLAILAGEAGGEREPSWRDLRSCSTSAAPVRYTPGVLRVHCRDSTRSIRVCERPIYSTPPSPRVEWVPRRVEPPRVE